MEATPYTRLHLVRLRGGACWRTDLKLKPFVETSNLKVEKIYKLSKTSLYTVLLYRKEKRFLETTREL